MNENAAKVDSDTTKEEENLTNKPESLADTDANNEDSSTSVPWDKDERWQAWREKEKSVNTVLEDYGFDSVDELIEDLVEKQNEGNALPEDIQQKLEKLATWEAHEAKHRSSQQKDDDPDSYIAELENRLANKDRTSQENAERESLVQAGEKQLSDYYDTVSSNVDKGDKPEEYKKILGEFLGVDNPFNDVDFDKKLATRKMIKSQVKKFDAFVEKVERNAIEKYRQGKTDTPPMSPTGSTANTEKKPKTMADRRALFNEILTKKFNQ